MHWNITVLLRDIKYKNSYIHCFTFSIIKIKFKSNKIIIKSKNNVGDSSHIYLQMRYLHVLTKMLFL